MMNIVVTRKTSLAAEAFARTMVGKNITIQKANSIKILMLNQFKGYINQISGLIRKPEKRYWIFNDGLGGAWRFDFVVYPVQQLVIISAFYAVAVNRVLPQRQRSVAQQNEGKSNVMRLSEADLRYIVSESVRRVCEQSDKEYPKVGAYTIVPDMGSMVHRSVSLKNFGWHYYILMYYSDEHTYCLMQREDNGKFFYTEIVDAPELGEKETKFIPVSISDIPAQIHHDAQLRLRK